MSSSLEGSDLKDVFTKYANFGVGLNKTNVLDNSKFFKLIKECGLIDDKLTRPEVDIAFQKIMKKERKMTYKQFVECLAVVAKKKGVTTEDIQGTIVSCGGPKTTNVTEFANDEWVQKQTDAEKYTGMHKFRFGTDGKGRGLEGRRDVLENPKDLQNLLDRSSADIRGRKVETVGKQEGDEQHKEKVVEKLQTEFEQSAHVREA